MRADALSPRSTLTKLFTLICLAAVLAPAVWVAYRTWPRQLRVHFKLYPSVELADDTLRFPFPAPAILGDVGSFDNELSAYLWFDYVRTRPAIEQQRVLLTASERLNTPVYRIYLIVPNDAVEAIPYLAQLKAKGFILTRGDDLVFSNRSAVEYARTQTALFLAAYNEPVQQNLETLSAKQLVPSVARFLIFKSRTDPRIRDGHEISSLSRQQATEMAADIIAVSKFYDLPLDVFLGIGAMENNYLNIRGDLKHSVWKRRAAQDDIILKRRRHRVLVSDYSIGVWQITRETLRYAHNLFRKDKRDYSQLPERLRPPESLKLDLTDSHVLTTYAGLLLRDLLDRFSGDVEKAVGAYNGGFRNPNLQYAAGVQQVAEYARNILERVTAINGSVIARTTLSIRRARQ
jgi:hypothetical protein